MPSDSIPRGLVVEELEVPRPGAGEALVRVHAAGGKRGKVVLDLGA